MNSSKPTSPSTPATCDRAARLFSLDNDQSRRLGQPGPRALQPLLRRSSFAVDASVLSLHLNACDATARGEYRRREYRTPSHSASPNVALAVAQNLGRI